MGSNNRFVNTGVLICVKWHVGQLFNITNRCLHIFLSTRNVIIEKFKTKLFYCKYFLMVDSYEPFYWTDCDDLTSLSI